MAANSRQGAARRRADPPAASEPLPVNHRARVIARATLAILLILLALWVAREFLSSLVWAAIIAITVWPLYSRVERHLSFRRSDTLLPLLFTLAVGLILFLPIALVVHQAAQESERVIAWITRLRESGMPVPDWIGRVPIAGSFIEQWWRTNLSDPKAAGDFLSSINLETASAWTSAFGGQLVTRIFLYLIALMALFLLLRHGAWLGERLLDTADRLLGDPGERLAGKMIEAMRGTVNGTVVVAIAEGVLIGFGYALAGVPNAVLFAFLTAAFAMLPFGAWAAFSAAALFLLLQGGSIWAAAVVFGWGAAVMLAGDYILWPTLVGGAARLPFLFALIGIFGGLQAFGLVGLFVGPVVMAALLTVCREWLVPRFRSS